LRLSIERGEQIFQRSLFKIFDVVESVTIPYCLAASRVVLANIHQTTFFLYLLFLFTEFDYSLATWNWYRLIKVGKSYGVRL
jgi:hypothetical protein